MSLVLVPIDGSPRSEQAIEVLAGRLRGRSGARVQLLYVHEPLIRSGKIPLFQTRGAAETFRSEHAAAVLRAAAARFEGTGIPVETLAEQGELYPTIARVATRLGASEVVLGVRRPWFARLVEALVRRMRPLETLRVPVTYLP
jgi:hypothetical protein